MKYKNITNLLNTNQTLKCTSTGLLEAQCLQNTKLRDTSGIRAYELFSVSFFKREALKFQAPKTDFPTPEGTVLPWVKK